MPRLVDTTIRLLSQEPLAGRMPTAEIFRLAEVLDGAGFAVLEVSGGGVFDSAVRRGVESPWERIRALKARTTTPLGLALRGRFLVGSRPVGADFVRRFVASAAENGIDVFRLHDPLNDVSNLREAGEAIVGAGKEFHAGLVYSPGGEGAADALVEQSRELPGLNATRALIHDPTGGLQPHEAGELVSRVAEASGLPVGFYCQGAAGAGLADSIEAARAGADLIACAVFPLALSLHRVAGESLAAALDGMGFATGIDQDRLWEASDVVDEHIGDEPVAPLAPRLAVRAAEYDLPTGLVAALDQQMRSHGAGDRLNEVLDELQKIRGEAGWPPLAAPIGQILASQALIHVLSARRYGTVVDEFRSLIQGRYGAPPSAIDATVARAVALVSDDVPLADDPPSAEDVRQEAEGPRGERGGARPDRALRRGGRAAPPEHPQPALPRGHDRDRRRAVARGADSGARPDRPGERHRRGRDRGQRHARLGAPRRGGARPGRLRAACGGGARRAASRRPRPRRRRPRRVAHGRRLLPRRRAGLHAVRPAG